MSWSIRQNTLIFRCQTSDMNGKISFYDQHNQEQAQCTIPYSSPQCISYYPNRLIEQNVKLRETSLVIRGDVDHHLNGNWSCHLGQNIESAFTYVRILNTFGKYALYFYFIGFICFPITFVKERAITC